MMIGQQVATNTHLVYVDDYRTGWIEVGKRLGICREDGHPTDGNYIMPDRFLNSNGIFMPAMKLDGKSNIRSVKSYQKSTGKDIYLSLKDDNIKCLDGECVIPYYAAYRLGSLTL
jgi:hypothetical protein